MVYLNVAVEGAVDEAIVGKLLKLVGAKVNRTFGKKGKAFLKNHIRAYAAAAVFEPWLVMIDLDSAECAPILVDEWLNLVPENMCFRVAVREVESWILADRENLASFLKVSLSRIPLKPEHLNNPKKELIKIATRSRSRIIRESMVPRSNSGRSEGPLYAATLRDFIFGPEKGWNPENAAHRSGSLQKAIACLVRLVAAQRIK